MTHISAPNPAVRPHDAAVIVREELLDLAPEAALARLHAWFGERGEPTYRAAQVFVTEADYDRAHRLFYAEREDEL